MASKNIKNVTVKSAQQFNVPDMLLADYIFLTKQGMEELEETLQSRHNNYFRNRKVSTETRVQEIIAKRQDPFRRDIMQPILESPEAEEDESQPLDLTTPVLRQYIDDLRKMQFKAKARSLAFGERSDR